MTCFDLNHDMFWLLLGATFLNGLSPGDFQEGDWPMKANFGSPPIKCGNWPIKEGKQPLEARGLFLGWSSMILFYAEFSTFLSYFAGFCQEMPLPPNKDHVIQRLLKLWAIIGSYQERTFALHSPTCSAMCTVLLVHMTLIRFASWIWNGGGGLIY